MAVRSARTVAPPPLSHEEREFAPEWPVPCAEPRLALGVAWAAGISLGVFWGPVLLVGWRLLR